ncbi:MAG: hypothetical protein VX938_02455, partial [Myxococcota bacterium]|nr:hypothetical protein [Myxococcota bacterium]
FEDCGECLAPCDPAEGCDDGDVCNGAESCIALVNGFYGCSPGETLNCDDDDPNTADSCEPSGGCASTVISCEAGLWKCAGAPECIAIEHVCDGQPQCADGSDEAPDPCEPPCGDGICDTYESWDACPEDCSTGSSCGVDGVVDCDGLACVPTALLGNGECNSGFPFSPNLGLLCAELDWDGGDCASPDSCGDGICQPPEGTLLCPADCVAAECLLPNGDGGTFDCNGDCWSSDYLGDGTCDEGHKAFVSLGDDADGEPVISSVPTADFRCETFNWDEGDCAPEVCGDGVCDGDETPNDCPEDCFLGDPCFMGAEEGTWDCDGWCSFGAALGDGVCQGPLNCEALALDGGDCWTCPEDGCDDGNPCTEDGCDLLTGTCFHEPNHWMPCEDGDGLECTQGYCQQVPATPGGDVTCLSVDAVQLALDPEDAPYFLAEGSCLLTIPGGEQGCFNDGDSHPEVDCFTCESDENPKE